MGRDVWRYARVMRVRFPPLQQQDTTPKSIVVYMAVEDLRQVDPTANATTATGASALGHRKDPLPFFAMKWCFDGLGDTFVVSGLDAFYLGERASDELVLTVTPEANADLFRSWRGSGNTPRTGTLSLLNTALEECFSVGFSGLRVLSVSRRSRRMGLIRLRSASPTPVLSSEYTRRGNNFRVEIVPDLSYLLS